MYQIGEKNLSEDEIIIQGKISVLKYRDEKLKLKQIIIKNQRRNIKHKIEFLNRQIFYGK